MQVSKSRWIRALGKGGAQSHQAGDARPRAAQRRTTTIRSSGPKHAEGRLSAEEREPGADFLMMAAPFHEEGAVPGGAGAGAKRKRHGKAPGSGPAAHADVECLEAEALVLRAALEDCLCHLVELYGPDILDRFLERCLSQNIAPLLQSADATGDTEVYQHADAAARRLRAAVESVRNDPTPPPPD